jgi:hypothetical protein
VESQHPIAFYKTFPSLRVGSQEEGKFDDLALSKYGDFSSVTSNSICNISAALS